MLWADVYEDEVGAAGPAAEIGGIESRLEFRASLKDFADVPVEIDRVFERGRKTGKRQRIDAIGRQHAADPAQQIDWTGKNANAQTCESVGFGESAGDD